VPTIVHTGESVSPNTGAAQNFSSSVDYTVTAEDATTAVYAITVTVAPLAVGDNYCGGIVAYIFVNGDPGYDANIKHGLIAAEADQSTIIQWYNFTYLDTGATGTALGTGSANTTKIINSQGATTTNYAAGLARAYDGGGYYDWFLPSKDELNKLYINRGAVGGFASISYWSSSEHDEWWYNAWYQYFGSGVQNYGDEIIAHWVRAVRYF
jgi:hypothetical protein